MSALGFTGNETRRLTKLLQWRNCLGVPWIAVCLAALPGLLAFMTASNDPNTTANDVLLRLGMNLIQRFSSFSFL